MAITMPNGNPPYDPYVVARGIPSVTTQKDEGKEFKNVMKFARTLLLIGLGATWLFYLAVNMAIAGDDWYVFTHLFLMFIPISALCVFVCWTWHKRGWLRWWDWATYLAIGIVHLVIFLLLVYAATDLFIFIFRFPGWDAQFWYSLIAYGVFVSLPISGTLFAIPLSLRSWKETTDVTSGALEPIQKKMEIDYQKWLWGKQHPRAVPYSNGNGDEQDDREFEFIPRVGAPPRADIGKDERMRLFLDDFFEGMVNGDIGMTQRDWNTGVRMPRSGVPLKPTVAKKACAELMKAGYLEWKDPLHEKAGVQFVYGYTGEELLDILLSNGDKNGHKNQVRVEGIPSVQTDVQE